MKVIRAEHAGFCWGVTRVVNLAEKAAAEGESPVYTYGPLIHNPSVIASLAEKGVRTLDEPTCENIRSDARVIVRAHGVPPEEEALLRKQGCRVINGTCPHVVQIEKKVAAAHERNRHVVILGDTGHAEVDALVGYAHGDATVVSSDKECGSVPADRPLTVVAQSTLDGDAFTRWTRKIRLMHEDVVIYNTRCDATEKRQSAAVKLCRDVDMMIVVGGKSSANTRRLAEICRNRNVPTLHIERAAECTGVKGENVKTLGVTAGASTPEWIIEEVIEYLEAIN